MDYTDKPRKPRKGEELDAHIVDSYLRDSIPGLEGDISIKQFPSGNSNLTYSIGYNNRELILRRPPAGTKAKSAHDMGREYRVLNALKDEFPYCPRPLVYCEDESVMGSSFYVMERIEGIIFRKDIPEGLVYTPEEMTRLNENFVQLWADLHAIDYKKVGLENFGRPEGYVKRQVDGWTKRYRNARTPDAPDFEKVMQWLHDNMPEDSLRPCIIHNDFKPDNLVLNPDNPTEIIGLLDWEMATIGDPLMDLGGGLAYWVQEGDPDNLIGIHQQVTMEKGCLTREQIISLYSKITGRAVDNFNFYYCFGLFRLAVISQQIYYRAYHGQSSNPAFKLFIIGTIVLEEAALRLIK